MKIFVTGGTGFVGTHFLQTALANGHQLIVQRRPGSKPRFELCRQPTWVDRHLDQEFKRDLMGCDALVHLASHTPNPPYASTEECIYWNVFASASLIKQASESGIKNIVIAGTCFEYGDAAIGMDYVHPATELRPSLSYPISKAAASVAFMGLARELNLSLQILRIFQVYGPGENEKRFWPALCAAAVAGQDFMMSSGHQVRDFIAVEDVATYFLKAVTENTAHPGKPIVKNVGSGIGMSLLEFANQWWKKLNAKGELKPGLMSQRKGELMRLVANINDVYLPD
jgi:nucleoside-diphosphate-sugar epimerase